jgi:hypothetical protein
MAGAGAEECEPCGPGTSSTPGAVVCDECPPGSFAEGGEPACRPCPKGTENPDEGQSACLPCYEGWYGGIGYTQCRRCGMYDKMQGTAPQGAGISCDRGVLNGTLPGFWAEYAINEDNGNLTRVWPCSVVGKAQAPQWCLGSVQAVDALGETGSITECEPGHAGPLCGYCVDGYYETRSEGCAQCPGTLTSAASEETWNARFLAVVTVMLFGLGLGLCINTLFFKSKFVDAWANFFYRVRTNPILAIAQLVGIKYTKKQAQAKASGALDKNAAAAREMAAKKKAVAEKKKAIKSELKEVRVEKKQVKAEVKQSRKSSRDSTRASAAGEASTPPGSDRGGPSSSAPPSPPPSPPAPAELQAQASLHGLDRIGDGIDGARVEGDYETPRPLEPIEDEEEYEDLVDLTAEEHAALVENLNEKMREMIAKNGTQLLAMFAEIDIDGNGLIDKAEFREAMRLLDWEGDPPTNAMIDKYFEAIDTDGGGEIDSAEFHAFLDKEAKALEVEKAEPPPVKAKTAPRTPDMLSLSASLAALAKFIVFDMTNYLQINSGLSDSMDLQWPPFFSEVTRVVGGVFNLNFLTDIGSLNCTLHMNYCFKVLCIMMFTVSILVGQPTFIKILRTLPMLVPGPLKKYVRTTESRIGEAMDRSIHANVILCMVVHGPLSAFLIDLLACRQFNDLSVLHMSKETDCSSDTMCMGTAGTFLMLFTIGIPATLAYFLWTYMSPSGHAKYDGTEEGKHVAKRIGFLVGKYEVAFFFYETLELLRKALLMTTGKMIPYGTYTKLVINLIISLFFFVLLVRFTPYKSPLLDVVVLNSHLCTTLTLFWGLINKAGFFTEAGVSPLAAESILLFITFMPLMVAVGIISIALREICTYQAYQLNVKRIKMQVKMQELKAKRAEGKLTSSQKKIAKYKAGQAVDTDGDGEVDAIAVDTDGDGSADQLMKIQERMDTDGDGYKDSAGIDTDGDGRVDTVMKITSEEKV